LQNAIAVFNQQAAAEGTFWKDRNNSKLPANE